MSRYYSIYLVYTRWKCTMSCTTRPATSTQEDAELFPAALTARTQHTHPGTRRHVSMANSNQVHDRTHMYDTTRLCTSNEADKGKTKHSNEG